MENENIIATGIYYIHSENITESRLRFRVVTQQPYMPDEANLLSVYGFHEEGFLNQQLGTVITKSDRLIAFPNVYQHQVAPFELIDPTKEGKRKILVFFLVNPKVRVTSTMEVPPQQADWYVDTMRDSVGGPFETLPNELLDQLRKNLNFMDRKEAEEHRKELMEERGNFVKELNETVYERGFSLCEH